MPDDSKLKKKKKAVLAFSTRNLKGVGFRVRSQVCVPKYVVMLCNLSSSKFISCLRGTPQAPICTFLYEGPRFKKL